MKTFFISLIFINVILISACSTTRAPSLNMLERRADYNGKVDLDVMMEGSAPFFFPSKTKPQEIANDIIDVAGLI